MKRSNHDKELDFLSGFISSSFDKISGNYILKDEEGEEIWTFHLEIKFPKGYPDSRLPIVREIGSDLLRNEDNHISRSGEFCLFSRVDEYILLQKGTSFKAFIEEILAPFLATQILILSGELDHFPQGEYSHGGEGVLESYKEYFKHDIDLEVLGLVRSVLGRSYRNKLCYCGSGKPIKFCHVERFKNLHHMSRYQLKEDIREMREYLEKD